MGWLVRISRVITTQINDWMSEAEDPEKILEEALAVMEGELIAMRRALAEVIASYKSSDRTLANLQAAAETWYERAQLAVNKGHENLAREALVNRQTYQVQAQTLQEQLTQQKQIITKVKQDLRELEYKYAQAKAKKSLYLARLRSASASQKLQEIMGDLGRENSSGIFEKIEARILELEAQSELMPGQRDPLDQKFAALEGNNNVEAQLAELKAKKLNH